MKNNKLKAGDGFRTTDSPPRTWRFWLVASFLLAFNSMFAQTDRIPVAEGAFSSPGGFAGNNWSVSNGASPNNQWVVSSGHALAAPFSGDAAFISQNGVAYTYNNASGFNSNVFFWRDVTVPIGEPIMQLTFDWNQQGENTWDLWQVFVAPTTINPIGNNTHPGSGNANVPAPIAGATYLGNGSVLTGIQSFTGSIPASFAGTTFRLIFSWKSEVGGVQPPAAIDNIRLTSAAPASFTATAQGGLWNSPATWVGGVVPAAGNDITIPAGSTVTANQVLNYRDITVNGNLNFTTVTTGAPFHTVARDLTVNPGGNLYWSNAAAALNQINIGRDLINDGNINAVTGIMTFNGTGNSQISGSGNFVGTGGRGVIRALLAVNNGTFTLNQTQSLTVTQQTNNMVNNFITNGRIRHDNAVDVFQSEVSQVVTTNMGTGYTTAPVVLGQAVSAWTASGTATANQRYFVGTNVYLCTVAGTFDAVNPPVNTTPATEANGTATLIWIGNLGNIGNSFVVTAVTAGLQYYCGDNLYICSTAGTPSAAQPPVHTSGTAVSGTATFAYVGTVAKVSLNYDATSQTVRSLNLVSAGSGYQSTPAITISNTGAGSGAAFSAVMFQSAGPANNFLQKATASIFTGSADPRHSDAPAGTAGNGVYSATANTYGWYNTVPAIGFTLPPLVNLVSNQGSGYTGALTIVVTGGTVVTGTALTGSAFTVNVADGRIISLYCSTPGITTYSVPPTITVTGGGGTGATFNWGTAFPTATVNLSNGTSGFITSIDITNNGYGYVTAPTVGLRAAVAGESAAATLGCRLQQLNIGWGFFAPQTTNPNNNSIMALLPSNRRINAFVITSGAQTFTSGVVATAVAPLPTFAGVIDMGGSNNLRFSHPDYAGTAGTVSAFVTNGSVELSLRGGITTSQTRTFPIGGGTGATSQLVHVTGLGTATTGFTYSGVRVSRTATPSGTVSPAGNITGIRGVRVDLQGTGTLTNLNTGRTMQMFYNVLDNLVSNNQSLFLAEATALSGPWTARSTAALAGVLPTTGNRTTATLAPGPYTNNPTMFFAWVNNGFVTPSALSYNVNRTTGISYNSIAPTALGGDNSGLAFTGLTSGDEAFSSVVSLADPSNNFSFQGLPVTGFRVHTNGFIQLDNGTPFGSPSSVWNNQFSRTDMVNVIAPFWEDLTSSPNTGAGATAGTRYTITGTAPNRIVIVEWANYTAFGLAGPQLFFQVELRESDNSIHFNYGNMQLYNGTQNLRYSYSAGIKGSYNTAFPAAGQVFAQAFENTNNFSHQRTQSLNFGSNGLSISPTPRSRVSFTPGAYTPPAPPAEVPPANDDDAAADPISSLSVFPTNIAWNEPDNKSRLYSTRYATAGGPSVCAGAPSDVKDVWFSFVANEVNVTARVYASGGFIPRVQVFNNALTTELACALGTAGSQVDAVLTGLTLGQTYKVRVSHNLTGTTASLSATSVSSGNVSGVSISNGGTNYVIATPTFGGPRGNRVKASGGGGNTFVGEVFEVNATATPPAIGAVTNAQFDGGNDYSSLPTLTVESPDWGITGEFAIVIYAPPINDDCSGAIELTSIATNNCNTGTNQRTGITTGSATLSPEGLGACAAGAEDDLWYRFVATGALSNIRVQGNIGFNPALQIWSQALGNCVGKAPVSTPTGGCLNATGVDGVEEVLLATTPGTTYWVRVYHAGAGAGGPGANFDICVTTPVPTCIAPTASPSNGSTVCATPAVVLSWPAVQYATAYDVYFDGSGAGTLVSADQVGTNYTPTLTAGGWDWIVNPKNANGTATCAVRSFTVISPSPSSTTDNSRCGIGTTVLNAAGSNLQWWENPTGGSPIATGTSYTTPIISTTTTYYVSAGTVSSGVVNIGSDVTTTLTTAVSPYSNAWESSRIQYLIPASELVAAQLNAGNITALSINVLSGVPTFALDGYTIRIAHTNDASINGAFGNTIAPGFTTVFTSPAYTVVSGVNTHTFSTPFNWNGTNNILVEVCFDNDAVGDLEGIQYSNNAEVRYSNTAYGSVVGTYADNNTLCGTTNGTFVNSTNRPNFVFSGQTICAGLRVPVVATVTPPPALTLSSVSETICDGASTASVNISSTIGDFDTYTFTPATGVTGGSTGPWTFNPTTTTNYLLTANEVGGCVNTTNINVIVNANPPVQTATFTANPVCQGGTANLDVTGALVTAFQENMEGTFPLSTLTTAAITAGPYTATQNSTYFSQGANSVRFNTAATSSNGTLGMANNISLVGATSAQLTFSHIAGMEFSGTFMYDFGFVEYSTNGGTSWTQFQAVNYAGTADPTVFSGGVRFNSKSYTDWNSNFTGAGSLPNNTLWKTETFNIPAVALGSSQFRVRFRYTTDVFNKLLWLVN
jgi:hypothetical protein